MIRPSKLADGLISRRHEILHRWRDGLSPCLQGSSPEIQNRASETLGSYLDEILGFLKHSRARVPRIPIMRTALDSVRFEVHALLLGEEVVTSILQRELNDRGGETEEWFALQRALSRAFHEALRINAASACDHCRWKMNESLEKIAALGKNPREQGKSPPVKARSKNKKSRLDGNAAPSGAEAKMA